MEASTLTPAAARTGLLARRSPLLKLQGDEKLVAMIRSGHDHAFQVLFERYHSRLLAFCRHMLRSTEDAEDVLQEVFVKAHAAMCADERPLNVRPWLYRIARNRCLNHLRRPVPDGQDSMDVLVGEGGVTTADHVQKREDFRALVADVQCLPETQRTALLLREIEALCYDEIALTMDTTVPAVKSLLVRARMSLAEATQSRQLTCGEVRLELAEAAEGLRKATGPVRHHVKRCEGCHEFRDELRSNTKALAALAPIGPLALLYKTLVAKLGAGGSGSTAGGSATGAGGTAAGTGAAASGSTAAVAGGGAVAAGGAAAAATGSGSALGGAAAMAGAGGLGGAFGAKAAATAATAALLTTGAVEVRQIYSTDRVESPAAREAPVAVSVPPKSGHGIAGDHTPVPAPAESVEAVGAVTVPAAAPVVPLTENHVKDGGAATAAPPITAPITDDAAGATVGGESGGAGEGATGSGTAATAIAIVIAETIAVIPTPPAVSSPPAADPPLPPANTVPPPTDTPPPPTDAPLPADPPPPADTPPPPADTAPPPADTVPPPADTPLPADTTPPPADTVPPPADTPLPADTTPLPADTTPPPADTVPPPADTVPPPADTPLPADTVPPPADTAPPADPLV